MKDFTGKPLQDNVLPFRMETPADKPAIPVAEDEDDFDDDEDDEDSDEESSDEDDDEEVSEDNTSDE